MARWVIETATNKFLRGGGIETVGGNLALGEAVVTVPGYVEVNPILHRYDGTVQSKVRNATQEELDAYYATERDIHVDYEVNNFTVLGALIRACWENLPVAEKPTWAVFLARVKTIHRTQAW
jgi:hypothetical protein